MGRIVSDFFVGELERFDLRLGLSLRARRSSEHSDFFVLEGELKRLDLRFGFLLRSLSGLLVCLDVDSTGTTELTSDLFMLCLRPRE